MNTQVRDVKIEKLKKHFSAVKLWIACMHFCLLPFCALPFGILGASLVAQIVKNLPAVQETWVRFLGQKDPLEEKMATYSKIFAWKIP